MFHVTPDGSHSELPAESSILYFTEGIVDTNRIGETFTVHTRTHITTDSLQNICEGDEESTCLQYFYCVAPIVERNSTKVHSKLEKLVFWAGCEVGRPNEDCASRYFHNSACFADWLKIHKSGIVYPEEEVVILKRGIDEFSVRYNMDIDSNSTVIVDWMNDPLTSGQ